MERTSVCVECRTALAAKEHCDLCRVSPVVSLAMPDERTKLVAAAWEVVQIAQTRPPSVVQRFVIITAAGVVLAVTAVVPLVLGPTVGDNVLGGAVVLGLLVAFAVLLSPWLLEVARGEPQPLPPVAHHQMRGSNVRAEKPGSLRWLSGRVLEPPKGSASSRLVLVELLSEDGGVTLRDAYSEGATVVLDDGRHALVPAGRIRMQAEPPQYRRLARRDTRMVKDSFDPNPELMQPVHEDPIPQTSGRRVVLTAGDRVKVAADFDEQLPSAASYRDSSVTLLLPRGIVWVTPE